MFIYDIKELTGISQQPDSKREKHQLSVMDNFYIDTLGTTRTRTGTTWIADVEIGENDFVDFFALSEDEAGFVHIPVNSAFFYVYNLLGEFQFKNSLYSQYIATSTPKKDFKLSTYQDTIFLINKNRVVRIKVTSDREYESDSITFFLHNYAIAGELQESFDVYFRTNTIYGSFTYEFNFLAQGMANSAVFENSLKNELVLLEINYPGVFSDDSGYKGNNTYVIKLNSGSTIASIKSTNPNNVHVYSSEAPMLEGYVSSVDIDGKILEINGDDYTEKDNYFVEYQTSSDNESIGNWVEVRDPKINGITYMNLPFIVKTNPSQMSIEILTIGDIETNPLPSFNDNYIKDIFVHQNRLCILSTNSLSMSKSRDYFNFSKQTSLQVLDTDPIDIKLNDIISYEFDYGVNHKDGLFLFSDTAMVVVSAQNGIFTPFTTFLSPLVRYQSILNSAPISIDDFIFYTIQNTDYSEARAYIPNNEKDVFGDTIQISRHCPTYLSSSVIKIDGSMEDRSVFVIDGSENIYCYAYAKDGGKLLYYGWYKWKFYGKILSIKVLYQTLYMVILYPDGTTRLESLDITHDNKNYIDSKGSTDEHTYTANLEFSKQYLEIKGGRLLTPTLAMKRIEIDTETDTPFNLSIKSLDVDSTTNEEVIPYNGKALATLRGFNKTTEISISAESTNPISLESFSFYTIYAAKGRIV